MGVLFSLFGVYGLVSLKTVKNHKMKAKKWKEMGLRSFPLQKNGSTFNSKSIELSRCSEIGKTVAMVTVDVDLDRDNTPDISVNQKSGSENEKTPVFSAPAM